MSTTGPSDDIIIYVDTSMMESPRQYVMLVSSGFANHMEEMLRIWTSADTVASSRLYNPLWLDDAKIVEAEILPYKPSQIQKTTRLGLIRYFCGLRGKSTCAKPARVRKILSHHDRIRNKRKAWLRSLE